MIQGTLFEGGTHGVGFVSGGIINQKGVTSNQLMHITDWYPTLLHAAGAHPQADLQLDGVDQWDCINNGTVGKRTNLVYNMKIKPVQGILEMLYLNSTLNFGIPPVLVFQLEVYYKVDRLLTGLTAQQTGTTTRWYSGKTSLF